MPSAQGPIFCWIQVRKASVEATIGDQKKSHRWSAKIDFYNRFKIEYTTRCTEVVEQPRPIATIPTATYDHAHDRSITNYNAIQLTLQIYTTMPHFHND